MRLLVLVVLCVGLAACEWNRLVEPGEAGPFARRFASTTTFTDGTLQTSTNVVQPPALPVASYSAVAAAANSGCASLRFTDVIASRIVCWGDLESPGFADRPEEPVHGMDGDFHQYCALREADDRIVCWGRTIAGTPEWRFAPVRQVAVGFDHLCALLPDDSVACTGTFLPSFTNHHLVAGAGAFRHVAAGYYYNCAIRTDDTVACWGDQGVSPMPATPAGQFSTLSVGAGFGCGIRPDGSLDCWGQDADGQATPPAGSFTQVSAGNAHACGLRADGGVVCWGHDGNGRTSVPATGSYLAVSAGLNHSCALRSDMDVVCWGADSHGQSSAPPLSAHAPRFTDVASGAGVACAVLNIPGYVDRPFCWGRTDAVSFPTPAPAETVHSITGTRSSFCGLRQADDTRICWGVAPTVMAVLWLNDPFQQIALGEQVLCVVQASASLACTGMLLPSPADNGHLAPPAGSFSHVAADYFQACAVAADGGVHCWGSEFMAGGPIPSPAAGQFTRVAVGTGFGCGITLAGSIDCWGADGSGQASPPAGSFVDISATAGYACAVRTTGGLACWGAGSAGQTNAPAAGTYLKVSAGHDHACALRSDHALVCWGANGASDPPPPTGNTPAGTDVTITFEDDATVEITFDEVTLAGETTITYSDVGPDAPAGFRLGDPPSYFDIESTATFGSATICVSYDPAHFTDEADIVLLHGDGDGNWVDVTVSFSADDAIVCGVVDGFSPFLLAETNSAPVVTTTSLPEAPVQRGEPVQIQATFTDANLQDIHSATIDWGDGTISAGTVVGGAGGGTVTGTHAYAVTGTFAVTVHVSDGDGSGSRSSSSDVPAYVVVFDATAGFVTGGGWFDSPAPACPVLCGGATGRATFGFVARYQRGRSTPTGTAQFNFVAGGLSFQSVQYEWLVIAGARASFRGTGAVNGQDGFGFMITAIDGALPGGGGADRLRVRIWDVVSGTTVYDNHVGEAEDAVPSTTLGGGAIMIHDR